MCIKLENKITYRTSMVKWFFDKSYSEPLYFKLLYPESARLEPWCFLPGNPFHTTILSADHRNKWMSAYSLPFPTHAKSEHHTAFRQWWFSQLLVALTFCAPNYFFSGIAKDRKFKIWEKWQKSEGHCARELFSLGWDVDWVRLYAEKCVCSLCFQLIWHQSHLFGSHK